MDYGIDSRFDTHVPELEELADVLRNGLSSNFANTEVTVKDCPDLTQPPFGLAMKGLGGNPVIADVGGPGNLTPKVKKDKLFTLKKVMASVGHSNGSAIGPGAGPHRVIGVNSEMMANCDFKVSPSVQSYYAKIDEKDGETPLLLTANSINHTDEFSLMANLLVSEGKPGKVLHIRSSKRIKDTNFVSVMGQTLKDKYGEKPVSLGGVFLIKRGKVKMHVMPDFPTEPMETDEAVNNWLKFFDMKSPLVCLSVFHSYDPGHKLRLEHTHCFSDHKQGGHYHHDVTPDEVEYEGYFTPANIVYRIDKC